MSDELTKYLSTYSSFSGCDMVAIFEVPINSKKAVSKVIGTLQTITYSIHNEKIPVRCLGDMNMKNVVFGGRIIAGSMVFTVFNRHWLKELMADYMKAKGYSSIHYLSDELPPINITISMANEYGHNARLSLYGVTFVNEGQVMSINDNYTENTFEYYAKDIDYLGAVASNKKNKKNSSTKKKKKKKDGSANKDNPKTDDTTDEKEDDASTDVKKILKKQYLEYLKEAAEDLSTQTKGQYFYKLSRAYRKLLQEINTQFDTGEMTSEYYQYAPSMAKKAYRQLAAIANKYYSKQLANNSSTTEDNAMSKEYSDFFKANLPRMSLSTENEYMSSLSNAYRKLLQNINTQYDIGNLSPTDYAKAQNVAKAVYDQKVKNANQYYSKKNTEQENNK